MIAILKVLAICYNIWVILIFAYAKLDNIVNTNEKLYTLQSRMESWLRNPRGV